MFQFLVEQLEANPKIKALVIPLVDVMPFLRYTMVKKAGDQLRAQEAAKLEKVGYRVRQVLCVGPSAEEITKVVNREQPESDCHGGQKAKRRYALSPG